MYINGKAGFKEAIKSKLDNTWLLDIPKAEHNLDMLCTTDSSHLRQMKIAIGSGIIFKYRIRFIKDLGEHIRSESYKSYKAISSYELEMNREKVVWEKDRQHALRMH